MSKFLGSSRLTLLQIVPSGVLRESITCEPHGACKSKAKISVVNSAHDTRAQAHVLLFVLL